MKEKKKLLFVLPSLRIGGAEKALVTLLQALDAERYDVDLFLFEQGGDLQSQVPAWINILPENRVTRALMLEIRFYFKDLLREKKISAAIARLRISIDAFLRSRLHRRRAFSWRVISDYMEPLDKHYDTAIAFLEFWTSFFVMDKVQAERKIVWFHSDYSGARFLPEEVSYYVRFDRIASITQACRDALVRAIPQLEGRVEVIENLVLPKEARARAEESVPMAWDPAKRHLITLGRLEIVKGIDLAIRACKILTEKGVPVVWHVFGDGSKRDMLTGLIDELQLRDSFILEGSVPNPLPYLKAAEIFVQPSRQEGKSIALDEAKLLGKAIVVTNYASVSDQITDRETGLITGMEPEQIAGGILELLSDSELRRRLATNCLQLESTHGNTIKKVYRLIDEA